MLTERDLIRQEAKIGSRLFGLTPPDRKREFFCLDAKTWIWHEEWNEGSERKVIATRYEVRGNQVIKTQTGSLPQPIHGEELQNLSQAVQAYYRRVMGEGYHKPVTR
jgi:hypothetical protein